MFAKFWFSFLLAHFLFIFFSWPCYFIFGGPLSLFLFLECISRRHAMGLSNPQTRHKLCPNGKYFFELDFSLWRGLFVLIRGWLSCHDGGRMVAIFMVSEERISSFFEYYARKMVKFCWFENNAIYISVVFKI